MTPRSLFDGVIIRRYTGDNSCRCSQHESSPTTIHAVHVSMNCRRRQFMPEMSLMLWTSPATIHAAWNKSSAYIVAVGIFWRHRGLCLFISSFYLFIAFLIWLRVQMDFFCVIRHTQIYQTKFSKHTLWWYKCQYISVMVTFTLSLSQKPLSYVCLNEFAPYSRFNRMINVRKILRTFITTRLFISIFLVY